VSDTSSGFFALGLFWGAWAAVLPGVQLTVYEFRNGV